MHIPNIPRSFSLTRTPGPWVTNVGVEGVQYVEAHPDFNDGYAVAQCGGPDKERNAHLIASAPDLLVTLERIEIQLSTRTDKVIVRLMDEARAAIAKAKGGN